MKIPTTRPGALTALILAGSRPGKTDPMALRAGVNLEQHRKVPLAMARIAGPTSLFDCATRLLTMAGAMRMLSRRSDARLTVVEMPSADAALDVDQTADLALAEAGLARRRGSGHGNIPTSGLRALEI